MTVGLEQEQDYDWERWADGRVWHLRRGRDFLCRTATFRNAAESAARRMGRPIRIVRDKFEPTRSIWLQFADFAIPDGAPCVCGGTRLYRKHPLFARCDACGSLLLLTYAPRTDDDAFLPAPAEAPDESAQADDAGRALAGWRRFTRAEARARAEAAASARAAAKAEAVEAKARAAERREELRRAAFEDPDLRLSAFHDIHLRRVEEGIEKWERYAGYAFDDQDRSVLLILTIPLVGGRRIPLDDSPVGCQYKLRPWPLGPIDGWGDISALHRVVGDDWDIVIP